MADDSNPPLYEKTYTMELLINLHVYVSIMQTFEFKVIDPCYGTTYTSQSIEIENYEILDPLMYF